MEKVSVTTYERKQMSIKTSFRRIAFAVVVTLSLGMLGTAPASAGTIIGQTMTVAGSSSSAANTIAQGETATVTVVNTFTPEVAQDSLTVMTSCAAPSGATCQDLDFFWSSTTDSVNASVTLDGSSAAFVQNDDDSFIIQPTLGGQATRFTSSLKFRASSSAAVGAYTVTVYTKSSNGGAAAAVTATSPSITWTVTVTAQATTVTSLNLYVATFAADATANYYQTTFATSKDSAVVAASGKNAITGAVTPAGAAVIRANAKNTLGETTTAAGTNICNTACNITATVTNGPGTLGNPLTAATSLKSVVFKVDNDSTSGETDETLVVYSDGTAGVSTITFYNSAGTTLGTTSVTFTGAPASATSVSFSDTNVAVGATPKLRAVIKDSGGTAIRTGTVYVYASDTKVVSSGAGSTNAAQYTQVAAGVTGNGVACTNGYDTTLGYWTCNLTIGDTGTAEITIRDSHSVAASTWSSTAITITGHGTAINSVSIAFDKASYKAGEQATITLTVKDKADRALGGATGTFTEFTSSIGLGAALYTAGATGGTTLSTTFTNYIPADTGADSGTETRVVYMPSSSGTVNLAIKYTPVGATAAVTATASAVVTNPAEDAAKAAEVAAAKAGTDAVAAAAAAEKAAVAAAAAAEKAAVAAATAAETAAKDAAAAAAAAEKAAVAAAEKAAKDAVAAAKAAQDAAVAAAEKAAKDAVAAAKAAQDAAVAEAQAATDAAAEAIDAANAATDAGNLAAEAADAATVAAEEARDAADAATAAVEELATQVASLMAALKAQITTLANTVAKIAKKVKA